MKLKWARPALQDLRHLYDYIVEDNPIAARQMVSRIQAVAENLKKHPQMGKVGRVESTRELVVAGSPYLVVYGVHYEEVRIIAVLHTAQRWPETLPEERLPEQG